MPSRDPSCVAVVRYGIEVSATRFLVERVVALE